MLPVKLAVIIRLMVKGKSFNDLVRHPNEVLDSISLKVFWDDENSQNRNPLYR